MQLYFCFVIWCSLVFSWYGAEGGNGWAGVSLVVWGLNMVASVFDMGVWMCNILVKIDNMYVQMDNMYVQIDNIYVHMVNMYVQMDNMYF